MDRVEVAIEVQPLDPATVDLAKQAGARVFQGNRSWRVVRVVPLAGKHSVRAQAHDAVLQLVRQCHLPVTTDPPTYTLRDPDTIIDTKGAGLLLDENRRAYDPDPLPRPKRKWYQVAMELGLGERKV